MSLHGNFHAITLRRKVMDNQSILKYQWILNTLDKMHNHDVKAETINAVFNIPLKDAREILKQYKGANHV
jgi:hypothetical protein